MKIREQCSNCRIAFFCALLEWSKPQLCIVEKGTFMHVSLNFFYGASAFVAMAIFQQFLCDENIRFLVSINCP